MNFDQAFEKLIGHEGGYVNNPNDPGGETKFGICKRDYSWLNIKDLTLDQAKAIYLKDYWGPAGCDAVPDVIKFDLFDSAVNQGVKTAIRMLQTASGAVADGVIGPNTLQTLNRLNPYALLCNFNGVRLSGYTNLSTWQTFGRGWTRRVAENLKAVK